MIINSLDKKCVLSISIIRNSGQSYKMKIYAKLRDRETDTDITYSTISCMYPRDLHYILDCYKNISEDKSSFGFTSCDQAINFWVEGTDFTHNFLLQNRHNNDEISSQCKLTFQMPDDIPILLSDNINKILYDNKETECKYADRKTAEYLSIFFPCMVEYVDIDLCVCKITIDFASYHITRKFDSSLSDIVSMKEKITNFKNGSLQSFCILGDFMEINFIRFGDSVDIQGEISDFTWPRPNEIKFHKVVSMNILDQMFLSIERIWKEITGIKGRIKGADTKKAGDGSE